MTLATIPRYDRSRITPRGTHALVVGGGIAGLLVARVLADAYTEVTLVERDQVPDDPVSRRGVPQGTHPHALLEAGRATVEDLLPGCGEAVITSGGVVTDFAGEVQFYTGGDFLADGPTRMETISMTRPLFEDVVRRHVTAFDNVDVRTNCRCTDYLLDETGTTVEGVVLHEGAETERVSADLVVDVTGRASKTPAWLERNGYPRPTVEEVRVDIAYSTTFVERPNDDRRTFLVPPSAPRARGGMVAPVEGDRWIVNLQGIHSETPPTDPEAFATYAASLPVSAIHEILDEHRWLDDITHYRFPSNRRTHFEALDRFPDGLLVVGDAIASYNPVYAQGMSVAALEALVLHHVLADGADDLAGRFFDRAVEVVDVAWALAVGADFAFAETEGPKPRGTRFFNWYLNRLVRHAHTDGNLTDAFARVLTMQRPPSTLFRPGVVRRVLRPIRNTSRSGEQTTLGRCEDEDRSVGAD